MIQQLFAEPPQKLDSETANPPTPLREVEHTDACTNHNCYKPREGEDKFYCETIKAFIPASVAANQKLCDILEEKTENTVNRKGN